MKKVYLRVSNQSRQAVKQKEKCLRPNLQAKLIYIKIYSLTSNNKKIF
jgi:hypothetical protein